MNDSHYKKTRIPKDSRTIPIQGNRYRGNGIDFGVLYRCWNCGVIDRTDREALGGPRSSDGVSHTDYYVESDPGLDNTIRLKSSFVLMEKGADGEAKEVTLSFKSVISTGCWFCGTLNWRGDY